MSNRSAHSAIEKCCIPRSTNAEGQWVERRDDVACVDMPKRHDLIVGKRDIFGGLAGRINIAARRCRNEVANFSYRRAHRCCIRPPDEPVAKNTTIARGQIASVYHCLVCEGAVPGNEQRDPVQMIALLDESRLDLVARSKAVLGSFLFISFCRMKPIHCGPFTREKCDDFPLRAGRTRVHQLRNLTDSVVEIVQARGL
jgi:hypothetical protein